MRLTHKGKSIVVTPIKPELSALAKAKDVLDRIALVPCDQQQAAKLASESLAGILASFGVDAEEENR